MLSRAASSCLVGSYILLKLVEYPLQHLQLHNEEYFAAQLQSCNIHVLGLSFLVLPSYAWAQSTLSSSGASLHKPLISSSPDSNALPSQPSSISEHQRTTTSVHTGTGNNPSGHQSSTRKTTRSAKTSAAMAPATAVPVVAAGGALALAALEVF